MSEYKSKFGIACDSGRPGIVRAFAFAELVCQPVSIVSVVVAIAFAVLRRSGLWTPPEVATDWLVPIFVSAAVGYLTNWIAITMLFEPYERTWRHWLPWVTFGGWRQGLVPKNKARIASVLAEQVATKLLRPEKLADDLCAMVGSALQDPDTLRAAQKLLQEQVAAHDAEIIEFLVPRIESALVAEIERLVTPERVTAFWNEEIMPRLESEETREEITRIALAALRKRAPDIAAKAKQYFTAQWASTGNLNGQIEEMYTGHTVVKLFGRQEAAMENYRQGLARINSRERYERFLHSGFPVILRDDGRSVEETMALVEKVFEL